MELFLSLHVYRTEDGAAVTRLTCLHRSEDGAAVARLTRLYRSGDGTACTMLPCISVAVTEHLDEKHVGEKRVCLANRLLSIIKESHCGNLEAGPEADFGGTLPTDRGSNSMACSAVFLIQCRSTCLGLVPPTVGWAPHH